jgi:hypothetical protein
MHSPQKIDHEGQDYVGLQAVLVEIQSISQLQDPMQVVALVAKEYLKQADVVSEILVRPCNVCGVLNLAPVANFFVSAGDFSVASWK